jgi:cell division protease FtsH
MVFHDPTTGAANDIEKATAMARKMVTEYGMSERVGAIKLGASSGEVFLGREMGHQRDYSEEIAGVVDEEVRKLIENAHDEAWHVINDNRDVLDRLVLELLEKETLGTAELATLFADVRKRPVRPLWLSSESRLLSDLPPVLTPAERDAMRSGANGSHGAYNRNGYGRNGSNGQNGANGSNGHTPQDASGDEEMEHKIDQAAEAGASPLADEEPRTQVIEVPDGGRVDPSEDY